jgi:hypothetical protein
LTGGFTSRAIIGDRSGIDTGLNEMKRTYSSSRDAVGVASLLVRASLPQVRQYLVDDGNMIIVAQGRQQCSFWMGACSSLVERTRAV